MHQQAPQTGSPPLSAVKPPRSLMRLLGRAIADYEMIREGDRILVGLSGGKDSWSLLVMLNHLRRYAPVRFELGAVTVDPISDGFDPSPLREIVPTLGIPYLFERHPILETGLEHMDKPSYCSWCARMKRGILYSTLRREGWNVLALAQHLDDLAESFLMSAFHGGQLRTMKAHYTVREGDLRVIRPLVYARERQLADFARDTGLPVIVENCPSCVDTPTQRWHMKQLLAGEERDNPNLFRNLLTAMRPLMARSRAE